MNAAGDDASTRAAVVPPPRAPATSLGERLAAAEARVFQGRRAEMRQAWRLLRGAGRLPRVLYVHGPPGIGKTTFVHLLARTCRARGCQAAILDIRDFRHEPAVLADVVAAHCAAVRAAGNGRPMLLVLDAVEEMRDLEGPLADSLLPGLDAPVLVVLSGRVAKSARAGDGHLPDLIEELELGGLTTAQARRLLAWHGVSDPATVASVTAFAAGNPLFLTTAAQHARSAGGWDCSHAGAVARSLAGRMTSEIADLGLRVLVEAASLVRTFNQELLATMTGRDVPASAFGALCSLSVVQAVPLGARLHDLVRESVAEDLRWRSPAAWQAMRHRAHGYLARLAAWSPDGDAYAQELVHLAAGSSPLARFYSAPRQPRARVRPARPDDLRRLNELCRIGITRFGLPPDERVRQLNADFHATQGLCAVAEDDDGGIAGFAYSVPLSKETWRAAARTRGAYFAALPAAELAGIRAAPEHAPRAALVTGATHLPGQDHVGGALREALFAAGRDRYAHALGAGFRAYYLLTGDSPELADIAAAGLEQRTTGVRLGDCLVDEWVLKLDGLGFAAWIAEALGTGDTRPYAQHVPEEELAGQVKAALEGIHLLERLRESPLTGLAQIRHDPRPAVALRTCLLRALRDLESAPSLADRQAGALLADYYVHQVGSMELIADKLRLPRTTFYRRLHRGLARVSQRLRAEELASL